MSIEWEITDDVMLRFVDQIESLKSTYGKDRILVMFLQLLGSLGLYVRTYKARAHPNAFKLLQSVYAGFDKVMTSPDYSPSEKKKLLYVELNKYKELKEQIDESKAVSAPRPDAGAQEPFPRSPVDEPDRGGDKAEGAKARGPATEKKPGPEKEPPGADVLQAIEQLAAAMEARFDQLASEIKSLKKRL
jgi:hypothetical protein